MEKICNNSRDTEFFLGDYYFMARPVHAAYAASGADKLRAQILAVT